MTISVFIDMPH